MNTPEATPPARQRRKHGPHWLPEGLGRLLYLRLVVPVRRERNGAHTIARGAMVGAFIGMTPTVGIQIPIVLVVWWAMRRLGWHFSVILAIAWTWLSNPATMLPLYYLFYRTGGLMLRLFIQLPEGGNGDPLRMLLHGDGPGSMTESSRLFLHILEVAGLQMMIGCLPYGLALGLFAYWLVRWMALGYSKLRNLKQAGGGRSS